MRARGQLVGLFAAILSLATAGAAGASTSTASPCRAGQLRGAFSVVPGSAGAGNIVYMLSLQNYSSTACFVSGLPSATLLGTGGRVLPTHGRPAHPGQATAALVALKPGARARADARFSPDVPVPGEQARGGRCEPVAQRLRVSAGGGTLTVPIKPPTSVCEHGMLQWSVYRHV
jgi:hypothetical protein